METIAPRCAREQKVNMKEICPGSPGWMRRSDAAKYLGIAPRTLSVWQASRLIPFTKVSHKVVLFRAADLDKALGRLTTKAIE